MGSRADAKKRRAEMLAQNFGTKNGDTPLNDLVGKLKEEENLRTVYEGDPDEFTIYPDDNIRLKLHTGEKRQSMLESIKTDGILEPVLVWKDGDNKVIMAGHNRVDIARELGIKVPYIIFDNLDRQKADRIVVITNLQNRQYSEMRPSELAHMLTKLIDSYSDDEIKETIYTDINDEFSLDKKCVLRHLRLNKLNPYLLQMLDDKKMPMYSAYNLSYASQDNQRRLAEFIQENDISSVSMKACDALLKRAVGEWDNEFISAAFGMGVIKPQKKTKNIRLDLKMIRKYIPEEDITKADSIIEDSLKLRQEIYKAMEEKGMEFSWENIGKLIGKIENE